MDKYGRELDLILLLADNGSYTAQEIADRLGITRRNLYNYFDYLRDCGFILVKTGTRYHLDHSSPFFRRLHENIALSEDEAAYICRRLSASEQRDYTAQRVRQKLARAFNISDIANPEVQRRVDQCMARLKEAIAARRMVVLRKYSSPHSHSVSDRIVEPYMMMPRRSAISCAV
jgi:predicted DNA-binding transcriptional regulator YafY